MIFEASLTKGNLETSLCPYVVSSKKSHSNVVFVRAQAIAFCSSIAKLIGHHLGFGHSLPNDFDVKGPLHQLNGTQNCPFQYAHVFKYENVKQNTLFIYF